MVRSAVVVPTLMIAPNHQTASVTRGEWQERCPGGVCYAVSLVTTEVGERKAGIYDHHSHDGECGSCLHRAQVPRGCTAAVVGGSRGSGREAGHPPGVNQRAHLVNVTSGAWSPSGRRAPPRVLPVGRIVVAGPRPPPTRRQHGERQVGVLSLRRRPPDPPPMLPFQKPPAGLCGLFPPPPGVLATGERACPAGCTHRQRQRLDHEDAGLSVPARFSVS
jgi:hypothetical protein